MVSQVICVVCSTLPEPHTTQITFYKFPKASEQSAMFKAWKSALSDALSHERPELTEDASLIDTFVCSRHFIASDFSFINGKLILLKDAIPSRIAKSLYESDDCNVNDKITKEYEPSTRTNNFATTLTKDYVTTSHNNLHQRSDLISTETSRVLTPTVSEFFATARIKIDGPSMELAPKLPVDTPPVSKKKRHISLEHKIESFEKIFKRLRQDNLLTESYLEQLKVQYPTSKYLKTKSCVPLCILKISVLQHLFHFFSIGTNA